MKIITIPMFRDNYAYLLQCVKTGICGIIDPAEPKSVLPYLSSVNLKSILSTHHHNDHCGGNLEILKHYSNLEVYGGDDRVPGVTNILKKRSKFRLGSLEIEAIHTPGHTTSSVCYYVIDPYSSAKAVFTGDTLFVAGCGRFFEGTANDMFGSLVTKLAQLPDETLVYCGHEYTRSNLLFAATVEPLNSDLIIMLDAVTKNNLQCTVPSSIGQEKKVNPFMRVVTNELQKATGIKDPIALMAYLRNAKNKF